MEPRTRWNDDRLDDFYEDFKRVSSIVERVPVIEARLANIDANAEAARKGVHAVRNDIAAAATRQAIERKSDRRWLVGTCLTSVALVIAAIGVLQGFAG